MNPLVVAVVAAFVAWGVAVGYHGWRAVRAWRLMRNDYEEAHRAY